MNEIGHLTLQEEKRLFKIIPPAKGNILDFAHYLNLIKTWGRREINVIHIHKSIKVPENLIEREIYSWQYAILKWDEDAEYNKVLFNLSESKWLKLINDANVNRLDYSEVWFYKNVYNDPKVLLKQFERDQVTKKSFRKYARAFDPLLKGKKL
jgi:hypothetical protein